MSILLSLLSGGATGLAGTLLSGMLTFMEKRSARAHELEKLDRELAIMDREAENAARLAVIEAESKEMEAEWQALQQSYRQEATRLSSGESPWLVLVDVVRGLMRPVLTLGLVGMVAWIYAGMHGGETYAEVVVGTVLYLATAAVLWWFGSRQVEKALKFKAGEK